jgi:hypothetical protein
MTAEQFQASQLQHLTEEQLGAWSEGNARIRNEVEVRHSMCWQLQVLVRMHVSALCVLL